MSSVPTSIGYMTVTARGVNALASNINAEEMSGTITFTPDVGREPLVAIAEDPKVLVSIDQIVASFDATGALRPPADGKTLPITDEGNLLLVAPGQPDNLSVYGWTWTAFFRPGEGQYWRPFAIVFGGLPNETVDLAEQYLLNHPASGGEISSAATVIREGDPRLSDARVPLNHTHEIEDVEGLVEALLSGGGGEPPNLSGFVRDDDARLSDSRTPLAHTHPVSNLIVTGVPDSTTFLRGDGEWATPSGGEWEHVITHITDQEFIDVVDLDVVNNRLISPNHGLSNGDRLLVTGTNPLALDNGREFWPGGLTSAASNIYLQVVDKDNDSFGLKRGSRLDLTETPTMDLSKIRFLFAENAANLDYLHNLGEFRKLKLNVRGRMYLRYIQPIPRPKNQEYFSKDIYGNFSIYGPAGTRSEIIFHSGFPFLMEAELFLYTNDDAGISLSRKQSEYSNPMEYEMPFTGIFLDNGVVGGGSEFTVHGIPW